MNVEDVKILTSVKVLKWAMTKSCFRIKSKINQGLFGSAQPCYTLWPPAGLALSTSFPLPTVHTVTPCHVSVCCWNHSESQDNCMLGTAAVYCVVQAMLSVLRETEGFYYGNNDLIFSYYYSWACKYQVIVSLDCIIIIVFKNCFSCWLERHKISLNEFWHEIRTEFPIYF